MLIALYIYYLVTIGSSLRLSIKHNKRRLILLVCVCLYLIVNITPYLSNTFTNRCRVSRFIDATAYLYVRQGHVFQIDRQRDERAKNEDVKTIDR